MNSHERMQATLERKVPDRVPVFSCTEAQNQVYEILGMQQKAVPISRLQKGVGGAFIRIARPLVNASDWLNKQFEDFSRRKVEADIAIGYDASWPMYAGIFKLEDNAHVSDIYGRLYDLVADADGNLDTPLYHTGLLDTPEKWDAWNQPDPDWLHKRLLRSYSALVKSYGSKIYLMAGLCWGMWENATQVMGLTSLAVALRRSPDFVQRMADTYGRLQVAAVHAAADAGMPAYAYADDMGQKTGPQAAPKVIDQFFGASMHAMTEAAHQRGLKIVIHSCGNVDPLLEYFADWGFDGVHSLEPTAGMRLADVKKKVGRRMCIFGNLDIAHVMSEGTRSEVERAVKDALGDAARDGGFVMAMTNSHNGVKVENTRWMIAATRRYGTYPLLLDPQGLA